VRSGSEFSGEEDELMFVGGYGIITTGSVCVALSLTAGFGGLFVVAEEDSPCFSGVGILGSFRCKST